MVIVTKTLSKTRSVFSVITTFMVVAAGFLAILFHSKMENLRFVSLVTGAKVAHADYLGGDAYDSYTSDGTVDGGATDGTTDGGATDGTTDGGSGPDGASEGAGDGTGGGDGE